MNGQPQQSAHNKFQQIIAHQAEQLLDGAVLLQQAQTQAQQFLQANQQLAAKYKALQALAKIEPGHELYIAFQTEQAQTAMPPAPPAANDVAGAVKAVVKNRTARRAGK